LESSDSEDSPIKKSPALNNKRRKMFIESSSEEDDEASKKEKTKVKEQSEKLKSPTPTKKSPIKLASLFSTAKSSSIKTNEESKIDTKSNESELPKKETKIDSVKIKQENDIAEKTSSTNSPKKSPSSKPQMKLITKESEEKTITFSKSTSNFFAGKKNEVTNKESQIAVSNSSSSTNKQAYLPNKENYDPIEDACWSKGEPVPYKALAQTLYAMEQTTKRLGNLIRVSFL
jgi:DNA ligase-1